ncbi:RHS repeat-associated core domain-containing protein [Granulicella arctica]|uniref:Phospholipase A2 domain-containing protein n=1 Tax=Granulicella arctica TaxID=940613 RepID=A0A7Y9PJY5_9BACT|nr:hypothetical protein [Granulicella arctica]
MGRWMSPDPYDGSMDPSNPQSMNRYAYVMNSPLNMIDPSGLQGVDPCHGDPTGCGSGSDGCGLICTGVTLGVGALIGEIASLFNHPTFHGSLHPRPASPITQDPNGVYNMTIYGQTTSPSGELGLLPVSSSALILATSTQTYPTRLFGTHYCGPGGAGPTVNSLDVACQAHDACYDAHGLSVGSNFGFGLDHQKIMALQSCNQTLCNAAAATKDLGATRVQLYFQSVPYGFCSSVRR